MLGLTLQEFIKGINHAENQTSGSRCGASLFIHPCVAAVAGSTAVAASSATQIGAENLEQSGLATISNGEFSLLSDGRNVPNAISGGEKRGGKYADSKTYPVSVEASPIEKKIIKTATLNLVVEDFSNVPIQVEALAKKFEGYVANSNLIGKSGETRHGTWKLRIPVTLYETFLAECRKLGEELNVAEDSSDVSEEFYDTEARIRNKQKEEEQLLKLLSERPGKLEEVLAVERELSRVREEVERMQGRVRVLSSLAALTTVSLNVKEVHHFEPEKKLTPPTLGERVQEAFSNSWKLLQNTASNAVVVLAALAPWAALLAVLCAILFVFYRLKRKAG